jgi:hypothetical protein
MALHFRYSSILSRASLLLFLFQLGCQQAASDAKASDLDFSGNWKVMLSMPGESIALWLVRIQDKEGRPEAAILHWHPQIDAAKIRSLRIDGRALRLNIDSRDTDFEFDVYAPRDENRPARLLGSVGIRGQRQFAVFERTDAQKLDSDKLVVTERGKADLDKAAEATDDREQVAALESLWKKHPEGALGLSVGQQLLLTKIRKAESEGALRPLVDEISKQVAAYGPEMELATAMNLAQLFLRSHHASLALAEARRAAALEPTGASPERESALLKLLVKALRKNGQGDEAKQAQARLDKVEAILDEQYLKTAIPFKPEPTSLKKSGRTVMLELFTGAECPPCVAADIAFDALLQSFTPGEVVLLQYHLHAPRADPLTNPDSEARSTYYEVDGTPTCFINGKVGPPTGGDKSSAQAVYKELLGKLDAARETKSDIQLLLQAERNGDKLSVHAEVSGVKEPGDKMRLRLALIEDVVRYPGGNGRRFHHHLVRGFPGGVAGFPLKENSTKKSVTVSVAEGRKGLQDYLARRHFDEEQWPLDLASLGVVAFVQNDQTKEILQAKFVPLEGAKSQKL